MSSNKEGSVEDAWSMPIEPFKKDDMKHPLLCDSSFAMLFPRYREKFIRECFPLVKNTFSEYGIIANLDLIEGIMSVKTTQRTWDPYIILKARDVIKLITRGVPYEQAIRVLTDDTSWAIIQIGSMVRNRDLFLKLRRRLVGSKGLTLKALEIITDCYILVQRETVTAVGPFKGLQHVRKVVEDTMNKIHPIYNIKVLIILEHLAKDPSLKDENWEKFVPPFKKKVKTEYTFNTPSFPIPHFPPPQQERSGQECKKKGIVL